MVILVTGATGNVGRELVAQLLAAGEQVRALTRNPERADLPEGAVIVAGDPGDPASMIDAMAGVDGVFLNLPGDPGPAAKALSEVRPKCAVLLSSVSAGTRPELAVAQQFRAVEERVAEAHPDLIVLRPGQFASNVLDQWAPMIAAGVVAQPFADVAIPIIDPHDIAAAAAATLTDRWHRGQTFTLTGSDKLSPRQKVEILAEILQRPLEFREVTPGQARTALVGILPPEKIDYVLAVNGEPKPEELRLLPTVEELTGRPPRSFVDWVAGHRALFG